MFEKIKSYMETDYMMNSYCHIGSNAQEDTNYLKYISAFYQVKGMNMIQRFQLPPDWNMCYSIACSMMSICAGASSSNSVEHAFKEIEKRMKFYMSKMGLAARIMEESVKNRDMDLRICVQNVVDRIKKELGERRSMGDFTQRAMEALMKFCRKILTCMEIIKPVIYSVRSGVSTCDYLSPEDVLCIELGGKPSTSFFYRMNSLKQLDDRLRRIKREDFLKSDFEKLTSTSGNLLCVNFFNLNSSPKFENTKQEAVSKKPRREMTQPLSNEQINEFINDIKRRFLVTADNSKDLEDLVSECTALLMKKSRQM